MRSALVLLSLFSAALASRCAEPIGPRTSVTHLYSASNFRALFTEDQRGYEPGVSAESITEIISRIGLAETVCYNLNITYGDVHGINLETITEKRKFMLELQEIEEIYPVKDSYNFSIPRVEARCWCDCPGGRDYCNSGTNQCTADSCVSYFLPHQTTKGCSAGLRTGSSQMCCSVELEPADLFPTTNTFTAFRLGQPTIIATVSAKLLKKSTGEVTYSKVRRVDLTKAHVMEDNFKIVLHHGVHAKPLLNQGWYFANENNVVYTGSQLNGLNEWDVKKLGWYKHHDATHYFHQAYLKEQITAEVLDCGAQKMRFTLDAFYTNEFPRNAKLLDEELEHSMLRYKYRKRSLSITRQQFPRVDAAVTFNINNSVMMRSGSEFERFDAEVRHSPTRGEARLKITIHNGVGSLEGKYYNERRQNTSNNDVPESFFLYVPEKQKKWEKVLYLVKPCVGTMSEVCLNPHQQPRRKTCQTVLCHIDSPDNVPEMQPVRLFLPVELPQWTEYLNPKEWFNGVDSPMELALMCMLLVAFFSVIICSLKLVIRLRKHQHS